MYMMLNPPSQKIEWLSRRFVKVVAGLKLVARILAGRKAAMALQAALLWVLTVCCLQLSKR